MLNARFRFGLAFLPLVLLAFQPFRSSEGHTPEQLVKELSAAARAGDTERFRSYLTKDSRKAVDDWLANQAALRQSQENFRRAMEERFPESASKEMPPAREFKHILSLIGAIEFSSVKERPDGAMELRVKTTLRSRGVKGPDGAKAEEKTEVRDHTFLARKENGVLKLDLNPGESTHMVAQMAALDRIAAAVRVGEFRDRQSALSELNRSTVLQARHNVEPGVALEARNPYRGRPHVAPELSEALRSGTVVSVHPNKTQARP